MRDQEGLLLLLGNWFKGLASYWWKISSGGEDVSKGGFEVKQILDEGQGQGKQVMGLIMFV